jgi:adenylate cyclase
MSRVVPAPLQSVGPSVWRRGFQFRSIQTRLMTATALWITVMMGCGVFFWIQGAHLFLQRQSERQLRTYSQIIGQSLQTELADQNWGTMQGRIRILSSQNEDFLYLIVTDRKHHNQIVASSPEGLSGQYVPTLVPLPMTDQANQLRLTSTGAEPLINPTYLLERVQAADGQERGRRGDRILEAAIPIESVNHGAEPRGTLRIGFSLNSLHRAIQESIYKALAFGLLGLGVGLAGAYLLSQRLSGPILRLRTSATQIASGDLDHRAELSSADEVGGLARSFNDMAASLQTSFGRQQRTLESFARFVPNKFLEAIAPNGIETIEVGQSTRRRITILFCDIRGYTAMAEVLSPTETFEFLNDYLAYMGAAIEAHGGFIDKYIGDAIMALFDEPHSDGALRAALAMQEALVSFNRDRSRRHQPTIEVGIGIHHGDVIMGAIGFTSRIESTVIGDAVNVAARIEQLTRQCDCAVLLTDAIVNTLECPNDFEIRLVNAAARVKGKAEAIGLYQLQSKEICPRPIAAPIAAPIAVPIAAPAVPPIVSPIVPPTPAPRPSSVSHVRIQPGFVSPDSPVTNPYLAES